MAGLSNHSARAYRLVALLLLSIGAALSVAAPASASSDPPFPINESFSGTTAPGWTFGGSAVLTAPGTDTAGNGWLRLTSTTATQFGYGFYDTAFPSTKGAQVEFDYATYGGTGADGLTFFLYDGATTAAQFVAGPAGGSLGYACAGSTPGLHNAYIGVGLDEYGNFGNPAVCGSGTDTRYQNNVVVRGSEANGYPILTRAATSQALTSTDRAGARHVTISIAPDKKLNVYIKYPDGTIQTAVSNYQLPTTGVPATLKLGYAGSTGGSTNYHEIRNTDVTKPTNISATVTDGATGSNRAAAKTWTSVVTNNGPNDTNSGSFKATTTQSLTGVTWTCTASAGSSCGAATSGTGLPNVTTGAMALSGTLTFAITGTPAAATDFAQLSVNAQPTGDVGDSNPNDNTASDSTDLTPVFDANPTFTLAANGVATATMTNARGGNMVYTRQWQRCNPDGTNCVNIAGATALTYTTTTADRGFTIRFTETGTNAASATTANSAVYAPLPTTVLSAAPSGNTSATTANLTFSTPTSGATLECKLDAGAYAACTSPKSYTGLADGSHTFLVRAVYGGLSDDTPESATWFVDTAAPDTSITTQPSAHEPSTSATFNFTGTDPSGSGVASYQCKLDAAAYVACTSPVTYTGLAQGNHTFSVRAIDGAGNTDATPASVTWEVDTVEPNTTIGTKPAANSPTAAPSFTFTGTDTGAGPVTFECRIDGGAWATCTSPKAYSGLTDGSHTFEVRGVDASGNKDSTPDSYTWTVDTTAPDTAIATKPASNSNSATGNFTFTGTDPSGSGIASFECKLDTGAYTACTSPKAFTALADGSHTVSVRAIDNAGNTDATPATYTWTVDTGAPDTTIGTKPAVNANTGTANFTFTGTDAGGTGVASYECKLDAAVYTACTSPIVYTGLADGSHTFLVRAIDQAGNADTTPANFAWTVDTGAPDTSISAGPATNSNSSTANFTFTGTDSGSGVASYECKLDSGAYAACTSVKVYTGLADGSHTFSVRSIDQAGNIDPSPKTQTWTIDTAAPDTTITAKPAATSPSATANFTFTGTDVGTGVASYQCQLDSGAYTACTSPQQYTGLADGSHTFNVRAIDNAGSPDPTPATYTWTVDTGTPTTTLSSGPATQTTATSATFTFTGADTGGSGVASFQCQLDSGPWVTCTSPQTYTGLADGSHTFRVRSVDNAGNADPAPKTQTWTVDATAPDTTITAQPAAHAPSGAASFSFTGTDGTGTGVVSYQCKLDSAAYVACTSPQAYTGLADGNHTFSVRATDAVGNTDATPATVTWEVDTVAPDTAIGTKPASVSNSNAPQFTFTGTDTGAGPVTFECRLDNGAWIACTSPKTFASLSDGSHTVDVRAVDAAGNRDATPATYTWRVDTSLPDTAITATPPASSASSSATFTFAGTDPGGVPPITYQCQLDAGPFVACTTPLTYTGLTDGAHTFKVRAIDSAGNVDPTPASYGWTIDTSPPDTAIGTKPAAQTNSTTANFTFTGTDAGTGVASFQCQLDSGAYTACTSPQQYTGLADGSHTFQVRAIDGTGTADPTPATYTWTVDTDLPTTSLDGGPQPSSPTATPTFTFSGTDGNGPVTFQCRIDGGAWATCTSPYTVPSLPDGEHTFEVRSVDGAGNADPAPKKQTWTVDTTAPDTTITAHPAANSPATFGNFAFTGTDGTGTGVTSFECQLDGGAWTTCTSPAPVSGLADGSHTFKVRAIDAAGNTDATPDSFTWTVDTAAPTTSLDSGPSPKSGDATPTFTFSGSDAGGSGVGSYECQLDSGAWAACTSPFTLPTVPDGTHTFSVRAVDQAGNADPSPKSQTWTVDTIAPDTTITVKPSAIDASTTGTFSFTGTDAGGTGVASYECQIDSGAWVACTSPKAFTGLSDGPHTVNVRAIDEAGNTDATPATYTWTVNSGAPTTTLTGFPASLTASTTANFTFTGSDSGGPVTFECKLDGGAWVACTSPKQYTGLADGSHTVQVRGVNSAGTRDATPESFTWTVKTTGPASSPEVTSPSPDRRPVIAIDSAPNSTVEVSIDGTVVGTVTTDSAGHATFTPPADLADGPHTVKTVGIDSLGNRGPASTSTVKVSATAPGSPEIPKAPASTSSDPSPTFTFVGAPGNTFECSLDGGAFVACTANPTFPNLPDGPHKLTVREVNDAGVKGPDRDYTWTVNTAKPAAPSYVTKPAESTTETAATFTLKAEPGTTIKCSVDGAAPVDCTNGLSAAKLTAGVHTIKAQSFDANGNASEIATYQWKVGTLSSTLDLTARLVTNPVIHANRRMTLLCKVTPTHTLATCNGKAYARINGKLIVVAQGTRKIATKGVRSLGVRVKLTAAGYKALKKNPNGLKVSLTMDANTQEGQLLHTRVNTMIYPTRKAAHFTIAPIKSVSDVSGGEAKAIKRIGKNILRAKSILCVGHTDGTKTGSAGMKAGLANAKAVCAALKKQLGTKSKVKITVQTKGSTAPVTTNKTPQGRAKNSRVVLLVRFP